MTGSPSLAPPPAAPTAAVPSRTPGMVRRTCHVDAVPDDGEADPAPPRRLKIAAAARDLTTLAGGTGQARSATVRGVVDREDERRLVRFDVDPDRPDLVEELSGRSLLSGFRAVAAEVLEEDDRAGPLGLLLFDLPTIAYLYGYADLRIRIADGDNPGEVVPPEILPVMVDMCSGWRADSELAASIAAGDGVPVVDAPPAPDLDGVTRDDPLAWHEYAPLAPGGMRRTRRIDVHLGEDGVEVDAFFRDTFAEHGGAEVVVHEYTLRGSFEGPDRRLTYVEATPRVLPQAECPLVADDIRSLAGTPAGQLRSAVRHRLDGPAGCTHLNDLLASVGAAVRDLA